MSSAPLSDLLFVEICSAACNGAGGTWSKVTNTGLSTANLNDVWALQGNGGKSDINTVGDGGEIGYCTSTNGANANCFTTGSDAWTVEASHTTNNLLGVSFFQNNGRAMAVGANGDVTTGSSASTWFSPVTALSTYSAAHGSPATTVTVSAGSGFGATSNVKLVFNGSTLTTTPAAVTTTVGGVSTSFTFSTPTALAAGTYEVIVTDSLGDAQVFAFTLG